MTARSDRRTAHVTDFLSVRNPDIKEGELPSQDDGGRSDVCSDGRIELAQADGNFVHLRKVVSDTPQNPSGDMLDKIRRL